MVRRQRILIPKPRSSFLQLQCNECGQEVIIFSHTTRPISCSNCGRLLVKNTGGKAEIIAENAIVIRRVD